MLIDTHCHLNLIIKRQFDIPLEKKLIPLAKQIVQEAHAAKVTHIINVGTSLVESINSITLAQKLPNTYAVVGIHPNDCSPTWRDDLAHIEKKIKNRYENKIVAVGECGLDYHYPDYHEQRQKDAFKAHIELALENNLPLVIHTRDAGDDTLTALSEFKHESLHGVIHCFSEDQAFADYALNELGFFIGIGGTVTYPNNNRLREVVQTVGLPAIVLETDAPFLPPQIIRGKKNHPKHIRTIAEYLANLLETSLDNVAQQTTNNAFTLFNLKKYQ